MLELAQVRELLVILLSAPEPVMPRPMLLVCERALDTGLCTLEANL